MRCGQMLRLAVAVLGLAPLLVLGGCGSSSSDLQSVAHVVPAPAATVRTARCLEWQQMSREERASLVAGMRKFFGGMVDQPGMRGQVLAGAKAYRVIDGYCAPAYARYFRLYRIYGDAAAFEPAPGR
ncbi:hypothetical protein [Nocardioides terrisoli]|uniref:hypothetical protein n=1 Tax=Nocardioides terrisoli TaxID=3388267 RepID=UPI00287B7A06|nr:hypothetical protein [Nocardioides marmorisolisilvae]